MRSLTGLVWNVSPFEVLAATGAFALVLACSRTPPTDRKPDLPKGAELARAASANTNGSPRVSCGEVTCGGETPVCCAKAGKSWCISEQEMDDGACPIDGEHFQLRCGAKEDCGAERCCYFDQMSNCAESCPHLGQLCETAEDCRALAAVTGSSVQCLAADPRAPFLKSCSERASPP